MRRPGAGLNWPAIPAHHSAVAELPNLLHGDPHLEQTPPDISRGDSANRRAATELATAPNQAGAFPQAPRSDPGHPKVRPPERRPPRGPTMEPQPAPLSILSRKSKCAIFLQACAARRRPPLYMYNTNYIIHHTSYILHHTLAINKTQNTTHKT